MSIAPPTAAVGLGAAQQFSATVSNATNTNVIWSVNGMTGGNPASGTIDAAGLYIAPQILPNPPVETIGAVSVADSTASASAIVTIASSFTFAMSGPSSLTAGNSGAYAATLTPAPGSNPATAIAWSLSGSGCPAACGTLATNGANATYTAPQTSTAILVTITATPAADASKAVSIAVTVTPAGTPPPITVTVTPSSASVAPLATVGFSAMVTGTTNTSVTWDVNGVVGGNVTLGTVTNLAGTVTTTYTAPANVPAPATVTVEARSNARASAVGSASVTIVAAAPALAITQLLPASAFAGSAGGFDLQVIGTNLGTTPAIVIAGTARTTICSSANECSAVLTVADLATAGNVPVSMQDVTGAQSNALNFVVVQETTTASVIALTPGSSTATGANIFVVDASTAGSTAPAGNVTLAIQAMGIYVPSTQTCTLGASAVVLQRPSTGTATLDICVFSVAGLDPADTYTITGPATADVTITAQQPLGLGIVDLTLAVPASAALGVRSLFVENGTKDKAVATGALEVR